jgi:hypothetical protein
MTPGRPHENRASGQQPPPPAWLAYVRDPAWMPHDYDVRRDTLTFAHSPRDLQRRVVFLDPRFLSQAPKSERIPVASISPEITGEMAGPLHFLFHTGFCCSTLLARALDVPGAVMGLKEPSVLGSFAQYWSQPRRTPGALEALRVTLDLLSRPLGAGETQVVKPSNIVNHIIPQLLHVRSDARALVLYSSLDAFLIAIARRGMDGRTFARSMFQQFSPVIPLDTGFTQDDMMRHTDLQIAAQAWIMQASFMDSIAKRFGPSRVRVLNSETFLTDKTRALTALGDFFRLPLPAIAWEAIAQDPVFGEHAKEHGRKFDADAYHAQQRDAAAMHADELRRTQEWAQGVAARCGAPLTLEETLFQ